MKLYHYKKCGLKNIWLANGYDIKNTPYGESVAIHDVAGLHKVIGLDLADKASILEADEIRFLRHELALSQCALAKTLGVAEITVRKWERDLQHINKTADRLLKILYKEYVDPASPARDLVEKIAMLDVEVQEAKRERAPMQFEMRDGFLWEKSPHKSICTL